jgi:Bacterial protein of unknown function (DUF885)
MLNRRLFTFMAAALPLRLHAATSAPWAHDFIEGFWRLNPDRAVIAGRFEFVPRLSVPSHSQRQREAAFYRRWRARLADIRPETLTIAQRTDLTMLRAKVEADLWELEEFRGWQWDSSRYNVAEVLDLALNTEYAPLPKRLSDLQRRLRLVPAFYLAARASLADVTREHTELALQQAPGVVAVIEAIGKQAPRQMQPEISASRAAVQAYQVFLQKLLPSASRNFRIGEALYETKFGHDIQALRSARQTYDLALTRRDEVLDQMDHSSQLLWAEHMGNAPMPSDRASAPSSTIFPSGMRLESASSRKSARRSRSSKTGSATRTCSRSTPASPCRCAKCRSTCAAWRAPA